MGEFHRIKLNRTYVRVTGLVEVLAAGHIAINIRCKVPHVNGVDTGVIVSRECHVVNLLPIGISVGFLVGGMTGSLG